MKEQCALLVRLRPIRSDEFDDYQRYFVNDYAQEIMDNYGHSNLVALKMAKQAIETSFPEGITADNKVLFSVDLIQSDNEASSELETHEDKSGEHTQLAGYLWRIINLLESGSENEAEKSCFISDFYILPSMRSKGLGKLAIAALEDEMKALGIKQIKLRVAYQNNRAAELYKAMGFTITGINMSKLIA